MNDTFGPGSNVSKRFIEDYKELEKLIEACKKLGKKIVLTSGTYDVLHIGHGRYLEKAKESAGTLPDNVILVVGLDSDKQVQARKGKNRPIAPQDERIEMLCHMRHVDLVTMAYEEGPQWSLMKIVRPDVLIITKRVNASKEEKERFGKYCGKVVELKSQATTSTSAKIRRIMVDWVEGVEGEFNKMVKDLSKILDNFTKHIKNLKGDK